MDSRRFHRSPPSLTLLRPARGSPLKRPCSRLLPLWTPHAYGSGSTFVSWPGVGLILIVNLHLCPSCLKQGEGESHLHRDHWRIDTLPYLFFPDVSLSWPLVAGGNEAQSLESGLGFVSDEQDFGRGVRHGVFKGVEDGCRPPAWQAASPETAIWSFQGGFPQGIKE
jgi:hypothetical protein